MARSPRTRSRTTAVVDEAPLDYCVRAKRYARAVVDGKIVAGELTRLACKRHLDDLVRAKLDPNWGYNFDRWHGNDVCDFIEKLPHIEGVWETPNIKLEDPQVFILVCIFGWRRNSDGWRRFSFVYLELARKAAKSTLTAGVVLYCTACEGEVGPLVIIGATTRKQADKVFKPAKQMVLKTPALQEEFDFRPWANAITCDSNGGTIEPINSKGSTQDGHNAHLVVLDELHAHRNRDLFDVLKSGGGARKNRLLWIITTAGFNLHGVCYEQRTYAAKILKGAFQADHVFAAIFSPDEGDDPFSETTWRKANPMLGITPTWESMRQDAADAKASPAALANFKTKNCNIWLGAAAGLINPEAWKACAWPQLDWDDFDGLDCWLGADLADKDDIAALAMIAFDKAGRLLIKPKFYLPLGMLDGIEASQGPAGVPYRLWLENGTIEGTPGDWIDHDMIEEKIREWRSRYSLRAAVFDQFSAAQAMAVRLNKDGDPDRPFASILHKKASNVTDPAKELLSRVKAGPKMLMHDGNECLAWMASNVVGTPKTDGTILPKKEREMSPNKIDGIDAIVNALKPFTMPAPKNNNPYNDRELRVL